MKFQSKKLMFTKYFLTGRTIQKLVVFHIKFSSLSLFNTLQMIKN